MRRRQLARAAIVLALLGAAGCGTTSTALDVGYPEEAANRALLASASPRRVQIAPVADRRMETARIGTKPKNGGAIVTSRPVADIVGQALATEVSKNRHTVVSDRPDVVLTAAVEAFSLDAVDGYSTVQYVGKVVIALHVSDGRTGETLLTRRYVGIARREIPKPNEDQWRDVMDTALSRTMHDLATDADLVAALGRVPTAARMAPPLPGAMSEEEG